MLGFRPTPCALIRLSWTHVSIKINAIPLDWLAETVEVSRVRLGKLALIRVLSVSAICRGSGTEMRKCATYRLAFRHKCDQFHYVKYPASKLRLRRDGDLG